jgi:acyl-CoA synthetase
MREIPAELSQRYLAEDWWTPDTLGDLLAGGLSAARDVEFRVYSAVRPWSDTFGEVERVARRTGWRRRRPSGHRRFSAR